MTSTSTQEAKNIVPQKPYAMVPVVRYDQSIPIDTLLRLETDIPVLYQQFGNTYSLRVVDKTDRENPRISIDRNNEGVIHQGTMQVGKYYRVDQFTLTLKPQAGLSKTDSPTAEQLRTISLHVHQVIPASEVAITGNCDEYTGTQRSGCQRFLRETKPVISALEQITGKNLGECFTQINYRVNPSISGGGASYEPGSAIGLVTFGGDQARSNFQDPHALDSHELLHELELCLNIPSADVAHHSFWNATQIELQDVLRSPRDEEIFRDGLQTNETRFDRDPRAFKDLSPLDLRCSQVKSYAIEKTYHQQREPDQFLKQFYQRINQEPGLQDAKRDLGSMKSLVKSLVDLTLAALVEEYCGE